MLPTLAPFLSPDAARCAKCGSVESMTIETLPPLEVCARCQEPWPAPAPRQPDDFPPIKPVPGKPMKPVAPAPRQPSDTDTARKGR
jgi:hypothetical protein